MAQLFFCLVASGCGGCGTVKTDVSFSSGNGPVRTEYCATPHFIEQADRKEIERLIREELVASVISANAEPVVYGGFQPRESRSFQPRRLEISLGLLPNPSLVNANYRLKSLADKSGNHITAPWNDVLKGTLSLRDLRDDSNTASIELPSTIDEMAAGGKMTFAFDFQGPTRLEIMRFASTDKTGSQKSVDAGRVTLESRDENSAEFKMDLQSDIEPIVLAFDSTGGCLRCTMKANLTGKSSYRFAGIISQLWVVTAAEICEVTAAATVDVTPATVPDEPGDQVAARYDDAPEKTHHSSTAEQLAEFKVAWDSEDNELVMRFPPGTDVTGWKFDWQVNWSGKREELPLE